MLLVDANVLVYAVDVSSAQHRRARVWLDDALAGREVVGFSWTVLLAFVRLTTHPAVFARPLMPRQALDVVRGWTDQPTARVVEPTARHLELLAGFLAEASTAANLVNDAHLAALAVEHDAAVVTFDADFGRFRGLRVERPGD